MLQNLKTNRGVRMWGRSVGIALLSIATQAEASKLQTVSLSTETLPPAPRWMFEAKPKLTKLPASVQALAKVRQAQDAQNYDLCLKACETAYTASPQLSAWIAAVHVNCALEGVRTDKVKPARLQAPVARIEAHPEWTSLGAQRVALKRDYTRASLKLIEADLKSNRARGWARVERLFVRSSEMSVEDRAELFRLGGEILFVDQALEEAKAFFERSLSLKPSAAVRDRLKAYQKAEEKEAPPAASPAQAFGDEAELVARITTTLKTGDLLSAVEDSLKLSQRYPGSTRKLWAADRMLESYFNLIGKADPALETVKERFFRAMLKFDSEVQFAWAKRVFARGAYQDALKLAEHSLSGLEAMAQSTAVLSLAARAALHTDQFGKAESYFQKLADQHAGTDESLEAVFHLGLLQFRRKNFSQASAYLEKLLALPRVGNWELSSRYWLWQSLKAMNSPRAGEQAQVLTEKFPFSYYGLRVRLDGQESVSFQFPQTKTKTKLYLTQAEKSALKRAELLIRAGWFEEASLELQSLPAPATVEAKGLLGLYFARAMDFRRSTALVNEAWDQDPLFRSQPYLSAAFPNEFSTVIAKEAQALKLDPVLVKSLIKQESAFGLKAVSSSGALGLMQMIPPTAHEIASQIGIKGLTLPEDLFQFDRNIRMGTYYLARMLDQFRQSVPLALAAYNAGPTRLERWLRSRPSLSNLGPSSDPMNELWFEELPWSETRFYVKAILRNSLLYKALETGKVQVSEPLWRGLVESRLAGSR